MFKSLFNRALKRAGSKAADTYSVFTRDFDVVVDATRLKEVLAPLSPDDATALDDAWTTFETSLNSWRTTANLQALETTGSIRDATSEHERQDTVVSILVDHSGSMRGQSILLAAATVEIACDFLSRLGYRVEILGFTTLDWKGGQSRRLWKRRGSPQYPGRLCDLLHIVYRSADKRGPPALGYVLKDMLRRDLLKENVDGEALEWAASRLYQRPEKHKILIVLSDGAPVDDSTLHENGPNFLIDHLRTVIARIEADDRILLAAIGINWETDSLYKHNLRVTAPEDLAGAMTDMLRNVLIGSEPQ
ncbi:cobalamin biosynthesis protein CobT [Rhizobium sp. R635]|uniref:cobaltochelatase CobT-related protein n=1 Tax=Rhizobium sp. R635 TaxID=1764275 RepID=UPI000B53450D|nr:cobalamin biosynthesis protein CobT [Rhizobium sp. R635]